jgi:hypothetical protein
MSLGEKMRSKGTRDGRKGRIVSFPIQSRPVDPIFLQKASSYSLFRDFVFPASPFQIPCSAILNSLLLQAVFGPKMAEICAFQPKWPESGVPKNTKFPVNSR